MGKNTDYEFEGLRLSVKDSANSFTLQLPGWELTDCFAGYYVKDCLFRDFQWKLLRKEDNQLCCQSGQDRLYFRFCHNRSGIPGFEVQLELHRGISTDEEVLLYPMIIPGLQANHVLMQSRGKGHCQLLKLPSPDTTALEGALQLMLSRPESTLQLAHPLQEDYLSHFRATIQGCELQNLQAGSRFPAPVPELLRSSPIQIFADRDGHQLMTAWGDAWSPKKKRISQPVSGWNSWDYYRWTITEDEVLANAEFIHHDPVLSRYVKRIIVDDGWQYCYGEWEANPLFPHGMPWLAKELRKMSFTPGLWIAPTAIEPHARIAQWDTDMLALGVSGKPCLAFSCMERYGFILDPTVEKSQRWLYDLFRKYCEAGYAYFKIDFLAQTLNAPRFHQTSLPRGRIMETLLTPIREATRNQAELLACGYSYEGGGELIDAVRVTGDIHALWYYIRQNAISIAARFWSHQHLWINDPDFALCRGPETSSDPDLQRLKCCYVLVKPDDPKPHPAADLVLATMNRQEAEVLLSLVLIAGSCINLSDKLPCLNETGLNMLRRVVSAPIGEPGVPLDLFQSELPETWLQKVESAWRLLLINWEEGSCEKTFSFDKCQVHAGKARDFWTDQPCKVHNNRISIELQPHSCRLLEIQSA